MHPASALVVCNCRKSVLRGKKLLNCVVSPTSGFLMKYRDVME